MNDPESKKSDHDIVSSLMLAFVILLTAVILCKCKKWYNTEPFEKSPRVWNGLPGRKNRRNPNMIYNNRPMYTNYINPLSQTWTSPNMVNFERKINEIQKDEDRQPLFVPNEETFSDKVESYRAGDWNHNGFTAMEMINAIKPHSKIEGFYDKQNPEKVGYDAGQFAGEGRDVDAFLGVVSDYENQPQLDSEQEWSPLAYRPYADTTEGFMTGLARRTRKRLKKRARLEDMQTYNSEAMVPSYGYAPDTPSWVRDESMKGGISDVLNRKRAKENRSPGSGAPLGYRGEPFMPGVASETERAFNKLMNEEDQNYYLGEQWMPPAYYTNPHYMRDWAAKFSPQQYTLFKEGSVETPSRETPVPRPNSLTSEREMGATQEPKLF